MRQYTRRHFIRGGAALAAAPAVLPLVGRVGSAFGLAEPDPSTALRNRLVVIFLQGGNDGLNTVVPMGDPAVDTRRAVYEKVRPSIGYQRSVLLPLDNAEDADSTLGLNPKLTRLHGMYRDGRVAIVQGLDYPGHSYSHFTSTDIWESGLPSAQTSGWIGRHLDRAGIGDGEIRAVSMTGNLPLILRGRSNEGTNVASVPMGFADGAGGAARHQALKQFANYPVAELMRRKAGLNAAATASLVEKLGLEQAPPDTGNALANALLNGRILLEGNYGCEVIQVVHGSFDTHAGQRPMQERLLDELDYAVDTFLNGDLAKGVAPMTAELASRTIVMTYSEFGRRIGENFQGTDHGAAAPQFMIGPPNLARESRLVPGLRTPHPNMGTAILPEDNLYMTTDIRALYQSVLTEWLGNDPDPGFTTTIPGLFKTPVATTTTTTTTSVTGNGKGGGRPPRP